LQCCFAVLLPSVWADGPPATKADDKPAEKWWIDRSLTLSPQTAPVPALRYRLLPLSVDRKEGNAVPIYLRLVHQQSDAAQREWAEIPSKWNELPLDRLPIKEAQAFLDKHRHLLHQLDLGARRKTAEWNHTLDQGSVIELLLPELKPMRDLVPIMILRARVEMAEGNFAAAVRALETGYAFSQHVAEGPFLIPYLIALSNTNRFSDCLLDFMERPGAPNLFWSLTVLPRPFIGLRKGLESEYRVMEWEFTELADLDRERTAEQWDALLSQVRKKREHILEVEKEAKPTDVVPGTTSADPATKSPDLAAAKKYLTDRLGLAAGDVDAMPPAKVLVLYIVNFFKEARDDYFKTAQLPYRVAKPIFAEAEQRLKSAPSTEATRFALWILPAIGKVQLNQVRVERKMAALRVIEALRLHAAAHNGQLPDKLSEVTIVPLPDDPGTGKAFEYQRDGATATLISRLPDTPLEGTGMRFRVSIRK
jgi:hypothetical protein